MEVSTIALLLVAGLAGGTINAVVGSGTLFTYPALIAFGLSPVVANGTNTAGLSVGSVMSAVGYRHLLADRMRRLAIPFAGSVVAAAIGALLVIALPEKVFASIVPWLIITAAVAVAVQPRVVRWLVARRDGRPHSTAALTAGTSAVGVYGGYFGAAQGVFLMLVLGTLYDHDVQRSNAAKNLMATGANVTAAVVFAAAGRVNWPAAVAVAVGAFVGGYLGAHLGRRLPDRVMRAALVTVAFAAAITLLVRQ